MILRLSWRSATVPPYIVRASMGTLPAKLTAPSMTARSVSPVITMLCDGGLHPVADHRNRVSRGVARERTPAQRGECAAWHGLGDGSRSHAGVRRIVGAGNLGGLIAHGNGGPYSSAGGRQKAKCKMQKTGKRTEECRSGVSPFLDFFILHFAFPAKPAIMLPRPALGAARERGFPGEGSAYCRLPLFRFRPVPSRETDT